MFSGIAASLPSSFDLDSVSHLVSFSRYFYSSAALGQCGSVQDLALVGLWRNAIT
jgi:hypothetical protein